MNFVTWKRFVMYVDYTAQYCAAYFSYQPTSIITIWKIKQSVHIISGFIDSILGS